MTVEQALDVFNPDNKRPTLQIQRLAFAVLEKALAPLSDGIITKEVTTNISNMTKNQNRKIEPEKKLIFCGYTIGEKIIIRTLTFFYVGEIAIIGDDYIRLNKASWVADTGRWNQALRSGKLREVEPFTNGVSVMKHSIVDVCLWNHDLPSSVI